MISPQAITTILSNVHNGSAVCDGFNDLQFSLLEKTDASLSEVAAQKVEIAQIDGTGLVLPTFFRVSDFVIHGPNYSSNELIIKKVYKHLCDRGLQHFFNTENLSKLMNILTNHDLSALCRLYSCQKYSQVVNAMLPSLYDIVFLIEDGPKMTKQYINNCIEIISNAVFSTLLYDSCGVYIRTLNTDSQADGLTTVDQVRYYLGTLVAHPTSASLGEMMYDKVYECVVKPTVSELTKPVLLVVLSNSVATKKSEVLESLERCRNESDKKMFITFVNTAGTREINEYYRELSSNPHVALVSFVTSIGILVK